MNILNEKEKEMQEKFEEIIQETGTKLIDYANEIGLGYEAIDILLVDFIANLIDFVLAFRFGNLLYVNYKAGFITYEQAKEMLNRSNIRPRYLKASREVFMQLVKEEIDREVM